MLGGVGGGGGGGDNKNKQTSNNLNKTKQKISNNLRMTASVLKQDPNYTDIKGSKELFIRIKIKNKKVQILGLMFNDDS